jgi:capsular polysaccharide biosynthesis protein
MNDEIDLRPIFQALMKAWKVIIAVVLVSGLLAGLIKVLMTPPYEARATLLVTNESVKVAPSTPIVSEQAPLNTLGNTQYDVVEDLMKSDVLMKRLENKLAEKGLIIEDAQLDALLEVDRKNNTTFILKTYGHSSADAEQLAALCAQEVIRFIYESYGADGILLSETEQLLSQVRERYWKAQAELEQFIESGEIEATSQEIRRISNAIEGVRAATLNRYNEYLSRMNQIDLLLREARLLRERLEYGNPDLSESLAALLFRVQSVSAGGGPTLQLDSSVVNSISATVSDMDSLISSLEAEYSRLQRDVAELSVAQFDSFTTVNLEQLYKQLFAEQTRLEQLNRKQTELTRERDTAYSLYETLLRRIDELELEKLSRPITVRHLGTVADEKPSLVSKAALFAGLGSLVGLIVSVFSVVARTLVASIVNQTPEPEVKMAGD